jgi:hypothetical protein
MLNSDTNKKSDAWRQLGLRLAGFCLPLVLGWITLEWWAKTIPNLYTVKRQRFEAQANNVDTLIIGSSSAFHDIKPLLISGVAFNLAGPYEDLYEDDRLLTKVLPSLPKLRRAIIQIQYPSLFFRLNAANENWRQYCYKQEWGISPMQLGDCLDCRMWSRLALRTPRYYLDLLSEGIWKKQNGHFILEQPELNGIDDRGWCPTELGAKPPPPDTDILRQTEAERRMAMHHGAMRAEWEAGNLGYLNHMVSILRQHNVDVIFVTVPVWNTYQVNMKSECWNEAQRIMALQTNKPCIYYYSFLTAPQLLREDFYDVDHLNSRGAIRFTQLLNSALNREN